MTPASSGAAVQSGTLPYILLPMANGEQLDLWRYKHRRNLVVFAAHSASCPDCKRYLATLTGSYRDLQEWETEIVAVLPGDPAEVLDLSCELNLTFPVVLDEDGATISTLGLGDREGVQGPPAGVVIADRWGEIYEIRRAKGAHDLLSEAEILDTIRFIEIQCPECGVGG